MNVLSLFAAEDGPHISLKAEKIFEVAGVNVTNSMIYGVFISTLILWIAIAAARRAGVKPAGGLTQFFEMIMEFIINMLEGIFGSRKLAVKYASTFGVFFIFIFLTNISGLLPIVGEGITVGSATLFRPFTADLNGTAAMAIVAIVMVQVLSISESGIKGHLKHYFTDKPWNPISFFIGILEVFGEFTRVLSLALRLFLNTAVGEILIAVFAFVGSYGASFTILPIAMFEILVAGIQAYVFTVLSATYLGLAIAHHDDHDGHEESNQTADTTSEPGMVPAGQSADG